jgi:hypothetical protein
MLIDFRTIYVNLASLSLAMAGHMHMHNVGLQNYTGGDRSLSLFECIGCIEMLVQQLEP